VPVSHLGNAVIEERPECRAGTFHLSGIEIIGLEWLPLWNECRGGIVASVAPAVGLRRWGWRMNLYGIDGTVSSGVVVHWHCLAPV
jgi:hypothetical protein